MRTSSSSAVRSKAARVSAGVEPSADGSGMLQWLRNGGPDVEPAILLASIAHFGKESTRALIDMSLRLHWDLLRHADAPLLVLGARGDQVCTPDEVIATARHHGVEPTLLPGLAHVMMLERGWEAPARAIRDWLATI